MTSSAPGGELVTLNVGGSVYTTTVSTLTKFDESQLADIAKRQLHRAQDTVSSDANNNVFIDRDGPTFRYVLNFLRSNRLSLPSDFRDFDLLENEAAFYQIEPLVDAVQEARAASSAVSGGDRASGVSAIAAGSGYLELYENCVDESVFVIAEKKYLDTFPLKWKSSHFNLPVYMANIGLFGNSYQFAGFGTKLMLIEHLLTSGWKMASTSFSCFADRKDALPKAVNRYVWHNPTFTVPAVTVPPPSPAIRSSTLSVNTANGSASKSNGPAVEAEV